jgi:hypothetical protein
VYSIPQVRHVSSAPEFECLECVDSVYCIVLCVETAYCVMILVSAVLPRA